jgi:hypothetical protein
VSVRWEGPQDTPVRRRFVIALALALLVALGSFDGVAADHEPCHGHSWWLTIYEHRDFKGERAHLCGGVRDLRDVPMWSGLSGVSTWNDRISSFRVRRIPKGWMWRFYSHVQYDGDYFDKPWGMSWVGGYWNDRISSLRGVKG